MQHPITPETRLATPASRLMHAIFRRRDPVGWADYHCVEEADGTFWVHTHGLRRRHLPDMEIAGVPHDMRGHAHQVLFGIAAHARTERPLSAHGELEGVFSAPSQNFRQAVTLYRAPHEDAAHGALLRIVDRDQPMESGFPRRLFASHLAAWAELQPDPARREAMCRRSLALFPGFFLEMNAGAGLRPDDPDLTDLQFRANLSACITLAGALFDQGRAREGFAYLEQAVARCPAWGRIHRDHILRHYRGEDRYYYFWREADLDEICRRLRPANSMGGAVVTAGAATVTEQNAKPGKRRA